MYNSNYQIRSASVFYGAFVFSVLLVPFGVVGSDGGEPWYVQDANARMPAINEQLQMQTILNDSMGTHHPTLSEAIQDFSEGVPPSELQQMGVQELWDLNAAANVSKHKF